MLRKSVFLTWIVALAFAPCAPAQWKEAVLHSFQGYPDGAYPVGGMVFDKQGNLYGATQEGGSPSCAGPDGCGIVFELSPPTQKGGSWTEAVLYTFKGLAYGDGAAPEGGLVMDEAGNLYGTTGYDGTGSCTLLGSVVGCGTVYEMSPPAQPGGVWTETVLYSFQGGNDGYVPDGDLVFDKAGNLYGATLFGGGKGSTCDSLYGGTCGIIFELSPPKVKGGPWTESVLHSFSGGAPNTLGDGAVPNGGLILDQFGNIYGTTSYGGSTLGQCNGGVLGKGCGTVFELARGPDAKWQLNMLHRFSVQDVANSPDGAGPAAGVVFDKLGNLLGTTYGGGARYLAGTVFRVADQSKGLWTEEVLYSFVDGNDGGYPSAQVLVDPRDGSIYGTTTAGGNSRGGTLFRLQSSSPSTAAIPRWAETVLYNFVTHSSDAIYPDSKLVPHAGAFYGNSLYGGGAAPCQAGCGTVYKVWP